ncbi:polycystic kidney disease protein 1-like 2 [Branchiostoma floridae]|uniref:Polycystic kidney disease protein 1-like 2 n=1 Tax=Branchiostoma floridae TaxID=7739 RepID=A0A9J7LU72_BRAFL|nr:polycystic kidney disease protein 1-like 2 [Branchiostoma floridae]
MGVSQWTVSAIPTAECEDIQADVCLDILPYTRTSSPNVFGPFVQEDLTPYINAQPDIFSLSCHPQWGTFLCSVYFPECSARNRIPLCREFCEEVKSACEATLVELGYGQWPEPLLCRLYPPESDNITCFQGVLDDKSSHDCVTYQCPSGGQCLSYLHVCDGNGSCSAREDEDDCAACEDITSDLCLDSLPYTQTSSPNVFGDFVQEDLVHYIQTQSEIFSLSCHPQWSKFLCSVLLPPCEEGRRSVLCEEFCEEVREACEEELVSLGGWPPQLRCSLYPNSTQNPQCFAGPEREEATDCLAYKCPSGPECISYLSICNGTADCSGAEDEASCDACSPIQADFCLANLPYVQSSSPNAFGPFTQDKLAAYITTQSEVFSLSCHPQWSTFLCSVFYPECEEGVRRVLCREFCEEVQNACQDELAELGGWPPHLSCSLFPYSSQEGSCFNGMTEEESCPGYWCTTTGQCVSYLHLCDGREDCTEQEDETSCAECEDIQADVCLNILPYTRTSSPNVFGPFVQEHLTPYINSQPDIFSLSCHPQWGTFLCFVFFPECENSRRTGLCREFCEDVQRSCQLDLTDWGGWPPQLNCSLFQHQYEDPACFSAACEDITSDLCLNSLPYTQTSSPNVFGAFVQADLTHYIQTQAGIFSLSCHPAWSTFLCSVLLPPCEEGRRWVLCEEFCEEVRGACEDELLSLGGWPPQLRCSLYPNSTQNPQCFAVVRSPTPQPPTPSVGPWCQIQAIQIIGGSNNQNSPFAVYRRDTLLFSTKLQFSCSTSAYVNYNWTFYHSVDSDTWEVLEMLSIDTLQSTINIPRNSLSYGTVELRLHVDVHTNPTVRAVDSVSSWLIVEASDLVAQIAGGSSRSVGAGKMVTLDASSSFDPDDMIVNSTLFDYQWSCTYSNGSACNLTTEQKGPVLQVPGIALQSGGEYFFSVSVSGGGRQSGAPAFQSIIILYAPNAPEVQISCLQNCDLKTNPSNRLALQAECTNCAPGEAVSYRWTLQPASTDESKQDLDWDFDTSTGRTSKHIGIKADVFQGSESYTLRADITKNNTVGFASYAFVTNDIPTRGNCTIVPPEGQELTTKFDIRCQGFSDPDTPLIYEFLYQTKDGWTSIYYGQESTVESTSLPAGDEDRDNILKVMTAVYDKLGASIAVTLNVTVRPLPSNVSLDVVTDLISAEGGGGVTELLQSGDTQAATALISNVGTFLNSRSTDVSPESKEQLEQYRTELTSKLSDIASSVQTVSSVRQVAAAFTAVTQVKEEVSADTQVQAAAAMRQITSVLLDQSEEAVGTEEVEQTGRALVGGLVNVLQAASLTADQAKSSNTTSNSTLSKTKDAATSVIGSVRVVNTVLLKQMVPGQEPLVINLNDFDLSLSKQICESVPGLVFQTSEDNWFKLPDTVGKASLNCDGNSLDTELFATGANPYNYAETSSLVQTDVAAFSLLQSGSELTSLEFDDPIDISLERPSDLLLGENASAPSIGSNSLSVHRFQKVISGALLVIVEPLLEDVPLVLYLKNNGNVSKEDYDVSTTLPLSDSELYTINLGNGRVEQSDRYTWLVFQEDFNQTLDSNWALGVAHNTTQLQSVAGTAGLEDFTVNYTLTLSSAQCLYFDTGDDTWKDLGCKVSSLTNDKRTHCQCTHLTAFGSDFSFFVAPNTIDVLESILAFRDIANNPGVVITCSVVLGIYIVAMIWARRKDQQDLMKVGVTVLKDMDLSQQYRYLVTTYTGTKQHASTTAKVAVVVTGEKAQSNPTLLTDADRPTFERAGVDTFLLTTEESLGPLLYIQIWHDDTGRDPSWFLDQVVINDMQEDKKYIFVCRRWLASDKEDSQTIRILPVATDDELKNFFYVFSVNSSRDFRDKHLWFGVLGRPAHSPFTRCQRVSCCLSLLLCTMFVNIMFYGITEEKNDQIEVAVFSFQWSQIMIGFESALIVLPVNILLVQLFRHLKPKPVKTAGLNDDDIEEEISEVKATDGPSSMEGTEADKEDKKKQPFLLPWWFLYIGWFLVFATCATSAFFTMLYGNAYGKAKTEAWLLTFFTSFIMDLLFIQPAKVLILAAMVALIMKVNEDDDDEVAPPRPGNKQVIASREFFTKRSQMYMVILEVVFYFMYLWVVLSIGYGHRKEIAFYQTTDVRNTFLHAEIPNNKSFVSLSSQTNWWRWVKGVLVPGVAGGQWYNGDNTTHRGYTNNHVNYLVGVARLRQHRTRNGESIWGMWGTYSGGGYVVELLGTKAEDLALVEELEKNNWVDETTSAVLAEFTIYNPNTNLFTMVNLLAEFPPTGGCSPTQTKVTTFRLHNYVNNSDFYTLVCEILYIIMFIILLVREGAEVKRLRWQYILQFWSWVEIIITCLSVCLLAFYIKRWVVVDYTSQHRLENPQGFINYSEPAMWDAAYGYVLSILSALTFAKLIRLLRFNKRLSLFGDTLRESAFALVGVAAMWSILFMAFIHAGFLLLGASTGDFRSVYAVGMTLWNVGLGMFDFQSFQGNSFWGPILFTVYMVLMNMVFLNFPIAIITESFQSVKYANNLRSNDHEIVDFFIEQLGDFVGKKERMKVRVHPTVSMEDDLAGEEHKMMEKLDDEENVTLYLMQELKLMRQELDTDYR